MPSKVTFTSAELLSFSRTPKGARARFQFSLTQKSILAMGWGDIPGFQHGSQLDGDLSASAVELTPNDEALKRHAVQLDCQRVHKFVATRQELEGKRGKGHRWTVQCDVVSGDPNACRKLEQFMLSCGKSELRVSYEKQAEQESLPGTEATDEQRQAVLEED